MRVIAVAVVVIAGVVAISACAYDDPSLEGHFKCDADHPCPSPETCVSGMCTGGGGSNVSTADGVKCGSATCPTGMQCCAGPISSPVCQPLASACSGGSIATCDGKEDCSSSQACCGTTSPSCGAATCSSRACQSADDCAGINTGNCCFDVTYLPWGFCC